jgi:hypothetical protein
MEWAAVLTRGQSQLLANARLATARHNVVFKLIAEMAERSENRIRSGLAQPA